MIVDTQASGPSPLVSIIIPCYNAEAFVREAIESALNQTYPSVEVIVIDDGSTDDSLEVIQSFGDRVRCESGSNRGGGAARNRGIELAEGEFVQFLDADDLLLSEKLELQVAHANEVDANTLTICLGRTSAGDKFLDWQYGRDYPPERDPVDFVLGGVLPTTAPLHRRDSLIAIGGFDRSLPCAQEFDLHLRLVCSGMQLSQIPEILFVVRSQDGSVSSDSLKVVRQKRYILSRSERILRSRNALTTRRSQLFAIAYAHAATRLELGRFPNDAIACRRAAVALWPSVDVAAWTPWWRPVVHLFGSVRTARIRRWAKSLRSLVSR